MAETEHPVDLMYRSTRAAWQRYIEMSTPWPDDPEKRRELIAHRTAIMETRVRILEAFPLDARIRPELRTLRAIVSQDKA